MPQDADDARTLVARLCEHSAEAKRLASAMPGHAAPLLALAQDVDAAVVRLDPERKFVYSTALDELLIEARKAGYEEACAQRHLTFFELSITNAQRCVDVFHGIDRWSPTDWACALAGEVGEACNEVKKIRRLDDADKTKDSPEERERLAKLVAVELADVIIYADLLATRLGVSLEDAVREKFNEVSDRRGSKIKLPSSRPSKE